jgi:hypothetical protein
MLTEKLLVLNRCFASRGKCQGVPPLNEVRRYKIKTESKCQGVPPLNEVRRYKIKTESKCIAPSVLNSDTGWL